MKAASAANMRPVLPAAVIRSALFLPEDGELVVDEVGLRSPELSVVDAAEFGVVAAATVLAGETVVEDWVIANWPD